MDGIGQPLSRNLPAFVDGLQAVGRYTFLRSEAVAELGCTEENLKKAVQKLVVKRRIAVPRRGFYAIVPLEYRAAGAPEPSWFLDDLMKHLKRSYYLGVLSAAEVHGAAHQRPQETQVVVGLSERPILVGRARIRFLVKQHHERAACTEIKTRTGTMRVATPETTALDLLRYVHAAGSLSNVATVLAELAERINPGRMVKAAKVDGELAHVQRLGYLLDLVGARRLAGPLGKWLATRDAKIVRLRPDLPMEGAKTDQRWRVVVNDEIEVDV